MLKVEVTKEAANFIKKRQPKHQRQIAVSIQALRDDPVPADSIALKGHEPYRRADVGEYRIIYRVNDETLHVAAVGKRNDDEVYRRFGRK